MNFKKSLRHSLKNRLTLSIALIFLISIWSLTFYSGRLLRADMEQTLGEQQFSTISLLAAQINHDLDERMNALKFIAGSLGSAALHNTTHLQEFLEQHQLIFNLFNGGIVAYRLDGTAIAELPLSSGRIGVNYLDIDTVSMALKEGRSTIGRPVIGKKLQSAVFGMTVPIRDVHNKVVGALSGVINLGTPNFLDKISEAHYGKSGGYLLVVPNYQLIVTATDKSRVMQPIPSIDPMLERFNKGYEGPGVYTNDRGVEVLGSVKRIPISDWIMVVTLPTEEAFSSIINMQQEIFFAALILTVLAGGSIWWMIRQQFVPLLAATKLLDIQSNSERPNYPIPIAKLDEIGHLTSSFNTLLKILEQREIALEESKCFLRTIAYNIPGMVSYWTQDLRCTFACEEFLTWFGRTVEQMQGVRMQDLLGDELFQENKPFIDKVLLGKSAQFERTLVKQNGEIGYTWGQYVTHQVDGEVRGFYMLESDITMLKQTQDALSQSEKQYRRLAEDMPLFLATFRPDGTLTYVNDALMASVKLSYVDLIGKNFFDFLSTEDKKMVKEKLALLTPEDPIESHEQRYLVDAGNYVHHRWTNRAVFDNARDVVLFQAFGEDITEYKKVENMLRESEAQKRILISVIPDLIFSNRRDGEYLFVHAPDPSLLFVSQEQLLHCKVREILPEDIADLFMKSIENALDSGEVQAIRYTLQMREGQERYFDARVAPCTIDTAITVIRDITGFEHERRKNENQLTNRLLVVETDLKDSEQSLILAADAAKLGVWIRDLKKNKIWASVQWRSLFGFEITDQIDIESVLQRIHPADLEAVSKNLIFRLAGTDKYELEFRIRMSNDRIYWIHSVGQVEYDANGDAALYRGISFDITKRKQVEIELKQRENEVMHLSRVTMLGQLSGALAHELNQPLTAILSNAQAAQRFLVQDVIDLNEVQDILQDIVNEDKRAGEIIRHLRLLFDKGETPQHSININELVLDVVHILRNDLSSQKVLIQVNLAENLPIVRANSVQLKQVLINFMINSNDAMQTLGAGEASIVVRTLLVASNNIQVSVIDQGTGIESANFDKIFTPFYSTKERGLGLGLSICRDIIAANGGRLWCENNPSRGASFHFSIPCQTSSLK